MMTIRPQPAVDTPAVDTPAVDKPGVDTPDVDWPDGDLSKVMAHLAKMQASIDRLAVHCDALGHGLHLAQTRLLDGLIRQVISLDEGMVAVRHRQGWFVIPEEEYRGLLHVSDGHSLHEPGTLSLLQRLVRPGDIAIDVGAHLGFLAVPLARAVGAGGRLVAIEPRARNVECLVRTLQCNGLSERCEVLQMAASDEDAPTCLFVGDNSMLGSLVFPGTSGLSEPVAAARLDSTIDPAAKIDLVKIDAEGAEMHVIGGMRRIVAANPDIFVIAEFGISHLQQLGVEPEAWLAAFQAVGLDRYMAINEGDGTCTVRSVEELKRSFSQNLLFFGARTSRLAELPMDEFKE